MQIFVLTAWLCALAGTVAGQTAHSHQHGFQGAQEWARVFDDPQRDAWQKPRQVIESLALRADAVVADIGAGTGYFSSRLARALPGGRVYAVDSEPDMVRYLAERAQREHLRHMIPVQATPTDPRLPERVDLILFVDVYHHLQERESYLGRLRAWLRPGGRIAVIDFRPDAPMGPPPAGRIPAERIKHEFRQAGFALQAEYNFLPHQYFLVSQPEK